MLSAPQQQYIRKVIHQLLDYYAIVEKAPHAHAVFDEMILIEKEKVHLMIKYGFYGL